MEFFLPREQAGRRKRLTFLLDFSDVHYYQVRFEDVPGQSFVAFDVMGHQGLHNCQECCWPLVAAVVVQLWKWSFVDVGKRISFVAARCLQNYDEGLDREFYLDHVGVPDSGVE